MSTYDPDNTGHLYMEIGPATTIFLWNASARGLEADAVEAGETERQRHTIFVRGLRQHVEYATNDGAAWQHRRVVFTSHMQDNDLWEDDVTGMRRIYRSIATNDGRLANIYAGNVADQSGLFMGRLDRRLNVISDQQFRINSHNANGSVITRKFWHPFNANLTFNEDPDDESPTASRSYYAADTSKLGNIYVMDVFRDIGAASSSRLVIRDQATLYWHEK